MLIMRCDHKPFKSKPCLISSFMMNVIDDFDINHSDECNQNPTRNEIVGEKEVVSEEVNRIVRTKKILILCSLFQ
jgi:hypothetical protein